MTEGLLYLAPQPSTQDYIHKTIGPNSFVDRWGGYHITVGSTMKAYKKFVNSLVDQLNKMGKPKPWNLKGHRQLSLKNGKKANLMKFGSCHSILPLLRRPYLILARKAGPGEATKFISHLDIPKIYHKNKLKKLCIF